MKLNTFWKHLEEHRTHPFSNKIYPDVSEIVAKKPLLFYQFLRERDHRQLVGSFSNRSSSSSHQHSNRRRSNRLLKKRRLAAPGNSY
mmetsp:Transcript_32960/g.33377  ORF Transcript_32960/g.33377 Transcript_32960/m.33377 type:complete len:87 (-) Transcript_32960:73-333(-)